ncbi:MAG: ABC transporter permease [Polyangiales bacterium]
MTVASPTAAFTPSAAPRKQKPAWRPARPLPYSYAIGPTVVLIVWSLASATGILEEDTLSAPWKVATTGVELFRSGRLQTHLVASLTRAGLGLLGGTLAGTTLALLAGLTRTGEALLDGTVQLKRSVPNVALIPLLILWFGIGESMKVVTITLGTMIPIYVQTHAGLRAIDARYVELARTLRLSRWRFIRYVALPGAFPGFLLGLRLASTAAWLSLVVVEQINATSGVGYMMSLARSYGQTEIIVLGLVIYGVLGLSTDAAVRWLERRALTWRRVLAQ